MTLQQLKIHFTEQLLHEYPLEEINSFFSWLAEHYLGYTRLDISLQKDKMLLPESEALFYAALKRLQDHEPIQYIIGKTEFYGLPFKVTPATLIPRCETEELVAWIISNSKLQNPNFKTESLLDIGTGTGCIAISLAKHLTNATLSALDISEAALHVAKENAILNNVTINFFQTDILTTASLPSKFDIIVSNPPYVREQEKKQMQRNVLEHEPEGALYVSDKDPLLFYIKITSLAYKHLNPGGLLYFEINEYLSDEMKQLLEVSGFKNVALKKDIFGKFRMIQGQR